MKECFILEMYIGKRNTYTTMVCKMDEIADTLRKHVYTECRVFHWQRMEAISPKSGWILREEFPWR